MTCIVGIDPGSTTGLVRIVLDSVRVADAIHFDHGVVTAPASRKGEDDSAGRDLRYYDRLVEALTAWQPDEIVIEQATDAKAGWKAGARGRKEARETTFRSGVLYALAFKAAADVRYAQHPMTASLGVFAYPVGVAASRTRLRGWMGGRSVSAVHADLERLLRHWQYDGTLTDHEFAALGLVVHHCAMRGDAARGRNGGTGSITTKVLLPVGDR